MHGKNSIIVNRALEIVQVLSKFLDREYLDVGVDRLNHLIN
jgi:hypothetical protein